MANKLAKTQAESPRDTSRAEEAAPSRQSSDVVLIHGITPDGSGLEVLRKRNERLEVGALRPIREGCPIYGEVVRVKPRPEFPLLCDVESQLPAPSREQDVAVSADHQSGHKGPAQVASDNYRRNWELIWRRSQESEPSN